MVDRKFHTSSWVTPKLIDLAVTTPFSLAELGELKRDYWMTDYGVDGIIKFALQRNISLSMAVGSCESSYLVKANTYRAAYRNMFNP